MLSAYERRWFSRPLICLLPAPPPPPPLLGVLPPPISSSSSYSVFSRPLRCIYANGEMESNDYKHQQWQKKSTDLFFFFFLFFSFLCPPFQDFLSLLLLLLLPWRDAFHQSCPVSRRVVVYYSEEESGGGRGLSLSSQGYVRDDLYAAVTFWPFAPPHAGGGHPLSQALLVVVVRSTFETRRDFLKLRGQQIYQKKKLGHLPSYVCGIRCIFEFVTLARLKSPVGNAVKLGGNLQQKEKPCCIKSLATK